MKSVRFGLAVIAASGLIVLAAGIRVGIWAHQAEAIAARQEFVSNQLLVLQRAMTGRLDLENGLRLYLSTGDAADLGRLDQARRDLAAALSRLDELFRDDPARIADIAHLAGAAESEAARLVALRGEGRGAAAHDAAGAANAKPLSPAFRAALGAVAEPLRLARAALGEQRAQTFQDIYLLLALVVLLVNLLVVVAIVSLSVSIHRLREDRQEREHEAMHDPLTLLPNRRYLGEWLTMALAAARRGGHELAVLYVDLDGFKSVNDRFGHETGDRVLQVTAARLRQGLRRSDFVARLGGDEFVAVLPDAQTQLGLSVLIERLQGEIAKAPIAELEDGAVAASIGAAWFPADGDTVEALLAAADRAMYQAKQSRRAPRSRRREAAGSGQDRARSAAS